MTTFPLLKTSNLVCALLLLIPGAGCVIGGREDLLGFPPVHADTPSETADRAFGFVRNTEQHFKTVDLLGAAEQPWQRAALLRLMDVYVSLSNDEISTSTGLDPQGTRTRRPPLFLYPRITSPLLAEAADGSGGSSDWILPIVLNRAAFERPRRSDAWLGYPLAGLLFPAKEHELPQYGRELQALLQQHFRFLLVPRDRSAPEEILLDAAPDRFAMTRPSARSSAGPDQLRLRDDAIEVIFRLPAADLDARWKRLAETRGVREIPEELFDLRIFPRLPIDAARAGESWRPAAQALEQGRWLQARELLRERVRAGGLVITAPEATALAEALEKFGSMFHHFKDSLGPFEDAVRALAKDPSSPIRVNSVLLELDRLLREDDCPAPVLLDRPGPPSRSFSFIACGDLQYHGNGSKLFALLAMIDPDRAPRDASQPLQSPAVPREVVDELRGAKFVLIAGDFGDGEGFSSSGIAPALDGLGLIKPKSPYRDINDPEVGEFPELREQIRRSSKAFFVVPGNHDGFASYGGVLNQVVAGTGYLLQTLPLTSIVGTWLTDTASCELPILVRVARITPPFYDGLVDWSFELGPKNVAFNYRGCGFVALNSSDLYQADRDQVGAVANNWGGSIQDATLAWTDLSLRHFGNLDRASRRLPTGPGKNPTFVFLHQDPRGAIASKLGFVEREFGTYHTIVAPMNELTLGYLGTHSNRYSGTFIPIITPIAGQLIAAAGAGENFHERWMRHTVWDDTCGNARGLIEVLNRNLAGAPDIVPSGNGAPYAAARISHVFMAHDDVPIVSDWLHPPTDSVFPEPAETDSSGFWEGVEGVFRRPMHQGTPDWGAGMNFHDGRRATVVRMDDVGDAHDRNNTNGLFLVTVTFPAAGSPEVKVRWIQIPQ
jgi:hypothetical protein